MNEKARLLEAIAGKNRGLLATEMDRVRVLSALERLEDHNPTPQTLKATELLEGNWRLLYTTSKVILGLDRFPVLQLGQIYQCLRMADGKLYNIAEIIGVPFLEGLVSVIAKFEAVSDKRLNVQFERYIIGSQRLLGYQSPNQLIKDIEMGEKFFPLDFNIESQKEQGWLEITYLDNNLRVGRGNEGNIFVLSKEKGI